MFPWERRVELLLVFKNKIILKSAYLMKNEEAREFLIDRIPSVKNFLALDTLRLHLQELRVEDT